MFGSREIFLAALLGIARGTMQTGEEIDLSLTEASFRLLDSQTIAYDQVGEIAERSGNQSYYSAPANVFKSKDGKYLALAGSTDAIFRSNARAIGRADVIEDERFSSNVKRLEHREEIESIFAAWFASHTQDEAVEAFVRENGTLVPIYAINQIYDDPQFKAREAIVSVPDEDYGEVKLQNVVPKFTNNPGKVRHSARALGADTEAVFSEYLGLDAEAVAKLKDQGIV